MSEEEREHAVAIERLKATLQHDLESHKAGLAIHLEDHKADVALSQSMIAVGASYANGAMGSLLLVNGGSVVAILTFIGNLWSKNEASAIQIASRVAASVKFFVWGLTAALLALGIAYLSQVVMLEHRRATWGRWAGEALRLLACIAAIASLVAFGRGAMLAAAAFKVGL